MSVWRSPVLYIGILLILLVAGLLGAPFLVDWNRYRATVEDYGRQLTGREVAVTGDISARLFPWPHIRLKGVKVANVPGGLITDVVRAETVEARMLLGSLLGGRVEVSNIRIVKPVFSFERLDTSEVNWWLTPQFTDKAPVEAERISIEDLEIVDGTVFISDTRRGGTAQFEDVDMSLSAQSLLGTVEGQGPARAEAAGRSRSASAPPPTRPASLSGSPSGFRRSKGQASSTSSTAPIPRRAMSRCPEPSPPNPMSRPAASPDSQSKVRALVFKAEHRFPGGPCASAQYRDRARRPRTCRQPPDRQRGDRASGAHLGDGRSALAQLRSRRHARQHGPRGAEERRVPRRPLPLPAGSAGHARRTHQARYRQPRRRRRQARRHQARSRAFGKRPHHP